MAPGQGPEALGQGAGQALALAVFGDDAGQPDHGVRRDARLMLTQGQLQAASQPAGTLWRWPSQYNGTPLATQATWSVSSTRQNW